MLIKIFDQTTALHQEKPIRKLLEGYTFVNDSFFADVQDCTSETCCKTYAVRELSSPMTPREISAELAGEGLRPATCSELLSFADAFPDACDPSLFATGSCEHIRGHTGMPAVKITPDGNARADEMFAERLAAGRHILAVKVDPHCQ